MFFNSNAKHVKKSLIQKTTSLGLVGLLVAAGLVATTTASQAEPVVEDFYCGEHSVTFETDDQGFEPALEITGSDSDVLSYSSVRLANSKLNFQILSGLQGIQAGENDLKFSDGTFRQIRSVEPINSYIIVTFYTDAPLTSAQAWPITATYDLGLGDSVNIDNQLAEFGAFYPCVGNLEWGYTNANDFNAFSWDDDGFGNIRLLSQGVYYRISADIESSGEVRRTVQDGITTFSYVTNRYSDADGADVDVAVSVQFSGNTVRWDVEAFEPGTNTPADITFYIEGLLGGSSRSEFANSNGLTYSTDRLWGDPVVVYGSNTGTTYRLDGSEARFSQTNVTSGFLEATLIGYDKCATDEEIIEAIDTFTSNYQANKNQDLPVIEGEACVSECQPTTQTINRGPGLFDVGGLPLCFERGFDSTDPDVLIEQLVREYDPDENQDIGSGMAEGESIEYLNVVQGGDYTLNAVLSISSLYQQDNNEVDDVDESRYRQNAWIDVDLDNERVAEERYAEFTLTFFVSGDVSRTAVRVSNLDLTVYDIDDSQFFTASGVNTYSFANPTILTARVSSNGELRVSENRGRLSGFGDEARVSMSFKEAESFVFRMGIQARDRSSSSSSFALDFTGGDTWEEAPVVRPARPGSTNSGSVTAAPAPTPKFAAKRTISRFAPESPRLLKAQRAEIRNFLRKNPELSRITCTGYTAGPVKRTDRVLAKKRATNVCAYIEKIKPAVVTKVAGRTPGLPLKPSSRKVIIRGYSVAP